MTKKKLSNVLDKMSLAALEARWKAGHKDALPAVLGYCLILDRKLPEWARLAWLRVLRAAGALESETWDDLLGPLAKGTHRKDRKLHIKLRYRIVCRIEESGDKVGEALFKKVAKEIKTSGIVVGWRTVKDIYYGPAGKVLRAQIRLCRHFGLDSDFLA